MSASSSTAANIESQPTYFQPPKRKEIPKPVRQWIEQGSSGRKGRLTRKKSSPNPMKLKLYLAWQKRFQGSKEFPLAIIRQGEGGAAVSAPPQTVLAAPPCRRGRLWRPRGPVAHLQYQARLFGDDLRWTCRRRTSSNSCLPLRARGDASQELLRLGQKVHQTHPRVPSPCSTMARSEPYEERKKGQYRAAQRWHLPSLLLGGGQPPSDGQCR